MIKILLTFLTLSWTVGISTAAYAVADYLDIKADRLSVTGAMVQGNGFTIQEGRTLGATCHWSANMMNPRQYWHTKGKQTFGVQMSVDNGTISTGPAYIPAGTKLGQEFAGDDVNPAQHPNSFKGQYGPVKWTASDVGKHTLQCTVNQPKQTSDRNPNNNRVSVRVTVTPKPKPKSPQLKSTNMKSCAKSIHAGLELDQSGLNPRDVSSVEGKKTVTLPLLGSGPLLNEVQCRYGCGKASVFYMLKCRQPKKSSIPNTYICRDKEKGRTMMRRGPGRLKLPSR